MPKYKIGQGTKFERPVFWDDALDAAMDEEKAAGQTCIKCGRPADSVLMLCDERAIVGNGVVIRDELISGREWYCSSCYEEISDV